MRPLLLLSVFLLTGLGGPGTLRADEAGGTGPDRVEALAKKRAAIRALVDGLGRRLDALEKSMDAEERGGLDRARRRARPAGKPKTPKTEKKDDAEGPEGGKTVEGAEAKTDDDPASDDARSPEEEREAEEDAVDPAQAALLEIAGTYEVDKEAFLEGMEDMLREQFAGQEVPEEFIESVLEQMRTDLAEFTLTFVLDLDLTWKATGQIGGEEQTASGTWERDGDEVTLLQTHENGEASEEESTLEGTFDPEDGILTLKATEGDETMIPFTLVLHRVPG